MDYQKLKSTAKIVVPYSQALNQRVLSTLKVISDIVGGTLGPNGRPVLIERNEEDLAPVITKDGVTVFKSLGFQDPVAQCIFEAARDAAIRTANEAGDGTTTTTILAESLVRNISAYCTKYPRESPQRVIREIERMFKNDIEPMIREGARKVAIDTEQGLADLFQVAKLSANGDADLAKAVIDCLAITGDEATVSILENLGHSRYEVSEIEGFFIPQGFEKSCRSYYPKFINDRGRQACVMTKPLFLLYHGTISNPVLLRPILDKIYDHIQKTGERYTLVVAACDFSDFVLAWLAKNFEAENSMIKVFPLIAPQSPQANSQHSFLYDLQAVVGAKVHDLLDSPLERATVESLGPGVDSFEISRDRSMVLGYADEDLVMMRVDELKRGLIAPQSMMDAEILRERIANIAGGIARLTIYGSSYGEIKEKAARADDAVCAVRGAIKHGILPGGGSVLYMTALRMKAQEPSPVFQEILAPTFFAPLERLCLNGGLHEDEINTIKISFLNTYNNKTEPSVFDFAKYQFCNPFTDGILDSVPAIVEAVRSSISIATLLGTLGGTVVFPRSQQLEVAEAKANREFQAALSGKFEQ